MCVCACLFVWERERACVYICYCSECSVSISLPCPWSTLWLLNDLYKRTHRDNSVTYYSEMREHYYYCSWVGGPLRSAPHTPLPQVTFHSTRTFICACIYIDAMPMSLPCTSLEHGCVKKLATHTMQNHVTACANVWMNEKLKECIVCVSAIMTVMMTLTTALSRCARWYWWKQWKK